MITIYSSIDPIAFSIGPLSVHWYGLIIAAAVIIGLFWSIREARLRGIEGEVILDFLILALPVSVIFARLYYVIFTLEYYSGIRDIFAIWRGGLAIHGVVIGGLLVLIIFCRHREISILQFADILAPSMILGQSIGRWGNFINQEAHGGPVTQEFISHFPAFIRNQMYIAGEYYHPTFLYESVWNLIVFFILIVIRRRDFTLRGDVFLLYLGLYSLGRFFIEGMRTDSLMLGGIRVAQLLSILLMIASVASIVWNHRQKGISS